MLGTPEAEDPFKKENKLIVDKLKEILEREKLQNNSDVVMRIVNDEKGYLKRYVGIAQKIDKENDTNLRDLPADFAFPVYEITDAGHGDSEDDTAYEFLSSGGHIYSVTGAYIFNDQGQAKRFNGITRTREAVETRHFRDLEPGDYEKVHFLLMRVEATPPEPPNTIPSTN